MKRYYFDYAAATSCDPRVVKAMDGCWQKNYANPSSLYEEGRLALQTVETAREKIAKELSASKDEIFFTSGGSESDNWAIFGVAKARREEGKHIVISSIEHKAVRNAAMYLKKQDYQIDQCPVNEDGLLNLYEMERLIGADTVLVSVIMANNEIGTIQDIKKISQVIKKKNPKTYFHTDACQATNFLQLNVDKLGVDLLTINASKIYGPRGIGVLYIQEGTKIAPLIYGGGQEKGLRAGTENVAGVVGMAESLVIASRIREGESKRLQYLRDKIIYFVKKNISEAVLNGSMKERLPNNINFSFSGAEGESLVLYLDDQGFSVSTGSACSASDLSPSHVLLAIGQKKELAHGSLRITLGRWTSEEGVDSLLQVLPGIVDKVRMMSATYLNK
ncbi:MAG: cysteine desulfurase family protein [Patescibacteria group bacterium]